jgi:uncharacterized protein (TIGR02270 family)
VSGESIVEALRDVPIVPTIVRQHAEEAAFLYSLCTSLRHAPHVRLGRLADFDERLAAHLDGLSVAGRRAWPFCEAALETGAAGAYFTLMVRAVEEKDAERIDRCFALAEAVPKARAGLISALGWLPRQQLQGMVVSLLAAREPLKRLAAVAACAMHRIDPGLVSSRRLHDSDPIVRARGLRTAGEIGCDEARSDVAHAIDDADAECRFWAAWSCALLGVDASGALDVLMDVGLRDGPHRARAFRLALQTMEVPKAHSWLREIATDSDKTRRLIEGSGISGDPAYVSWLIGHMANPATARLAAESFTLITGADLDALRLEGKRPEDVASVPNDNPDDPSVDTDLDDGLPWPDARKIDQWWKVNESRFRKGTRYFMGSPVTRERCVEVLKNGYQRQRVLAAHYLCLLEPGTPLFNTSAPAWRQQRWLAKM